MATVPTRGPAKKGTSPSKPAKTSVPRGRKVETPSSTGKGDTKATKKPGKSDALFNANKGVKKDVGSKPRVSNAAKKPSK